MTFRHGTTVLHTLDPAGPRLSDLEPLRNVVAGARVVGLGEGAHFVREFTLARARLLRFLVEECGITVLAFELGAVEASSVNPWLAGGGSDEDLTRLAAPLTLAVHGELLRWLRTYNRGRPDPLTVTGIDLPNTLTLSPDLEKVAAYLRAADPPAADLLAPVLPIAGAITGGSAVVSATQWTALGTARQDALTAGLARLAFRLSLAEPLHADPEGHATALRHLGTARHTDYQLRAMHDLFAGRGLPADPSLRECFMAATTLAAAHPEARIALVAHNSHIQKTPVSYDGELAALPTGYYLARALGGAYRAVALTHTGPRVPEMAYPAEHSPVGFTVEDAGLPAPAEGGVERALLDAGFGASPTLTDLSTPGPALTSIRSQSAVTDTDVRAAFDAVLSTPTATRDATVPF